eukprot:scaffold237_cov233-Pinguiococcus_pyrenoidosus.AAC.4
MVRGAPQAIVETIADHHARGAFLQLAVEGFRQEPQVIRIQSDIPQHQRPTRAAVWRRRHHTEAVHDAHLSNALLELHNDRDGNALSSRRGQLRLDDKPLNLRCNHQRSRDSGRAPRSQPGLPRHDSQLAMRVGARGFLELARQVDLPLQPLFADVPDSQIQVLVESQHQAADPQKRHRRRRAHPKAEVQAKVRDEAAQRRGHREDGPRGLRRGRPEACPEHRAVRETRDAISFIQPGDASQMIRHRLGLVARILFNLETLRQLARQQRRAVALPV